MSQKEIKEVWIEGTKVLVREVDAAGKETVRQLSHAEIFESWAQSMGKEEQA